MRGRLLSSFIASVGIFSFVGSMWFENHLPLPPAPVPHLCSQSFFLSAPHLWQVLNSLLLQPCKLYLAEQRALINESAQIANVRWAEVS